MNENVAGIILAGGRSRRMGGGDKSMRLVGGSPMLERVIDRLRPQVGTLALNANGDPARFADTGLPVIADPVEGHVGPLAGVLAGMDWAAASPSVTHIVTVASDTPFFPLDLVTAFLDVNEGRNDRIVLAESDGHRHPVFGLWPLSLRWDLEQFLRQTENYKVLAFVDRHDSRVATFTLRHGNASTIDPFFNANTPGDIDLAEQYAAEIVE